MFSYFKKSKNQKSLYFQLEQEFKKIDSEFKVAGVYAIYKDDICLYVGQSKNIPSRLATHLSGKYKDCSKILVFTVIDEYSDLIPLEKFTMQLLKPIENILVDFTEEIDKEELAEGSIVYGMDYCDCYQEEFKIESFSDIEIINSRHDILISHEPEVDLYADAKATDYMITLLNGVIAKFKQSRKSWVLAKCKKYSMILQSKETRSF